VTKCPKHTVRTFVQQWTGGPFSNRYLYGDLGLVRLQDRRRVSWSQALT